MDSSVAVDLPDLKAQLDAWRGSHRKRARIPDHFYKHAVSLLDRYCRVRHLPANSSASSFAQETCCSDTRRSADIRRAATIAILTTQYLRPCAVPCSRGRLARPPALRACRRLALDAASAHARPGSTRSPLPELSSFLSHDPTPATTPDHAGL